MEQWVASSHDLTAPFFTRRCAQIIKFLANPRSLLDIIHWLVCIQECLECCNILLPSYIKPLMWWWSYEWPLIITWQPFLTRRCAQENHSSEIKFLANPRSLLDVIEWLAGIQECLECCNILLPSYTKPLMWWWSHEWPQLITWQPFFTRRCAQISVWGEIFGKPHVTIRRNALTGWYPRVLGVL